MSLELNQAKLGYWNAWLDRVMVSINATFPPRSDEWNQYTKDAMNLYCLVVQIIEGEDT